MTGSIDYYSKAAECAATLLALAGAERWDEIPDVEKLMKLNVEKIMQCDEDPSTLSEHERILRSVYITTIKNDSDKASELISKQIGNIEDFLTKGARLSKISKAYGASDSVINVSNEA